ncbi:MAG TPA: hypothetical protein VJ951_10535, partial [Bacteroidales bacterium]|nr:hypothetical protein [Bacteroidales bacterium]
MNKIKCIIVNITLVIITSCSTTPSAQEVVHGQQQSEQTTTVSTEETTQETPSFPSGHPYSDERIAEALSTMHPQLTDIYIGDDGLFQIVAPDSEYFNDSWYKGYAGMFTQEDLNGRTIGGYEINPPMQIFGSWSSDGREYFERVEDDNYGLMPRSTLYRNDLRPQLMGISRFTEQTPYREL